MVVNDELRQKLMEMRNRIWQSAFDAGYSAALEMLSETLDMPPLLVADPVSNDGTVKDSTAIKAKKARVTSGAPRLSGNNVRELILQIVRQTPHTVTAGEFSRHYPHISSSTRYTAARQLAEEGLIVRDNDRWSAPKSEADNSNNRLERQDGFTNRLQKHEESNLSGD